MMMTEKIQAILIYDELKDNSYFESLMSDQDLKYDKVYVLVIGKQKKIFPNEESSAQYLSYINIPLPMEISSLDSLSEHGLADYSNRLIDVLLIDKILRPGIGCHLHFYNHSYYFMAAHFKERLTAKINVYVDELTVIEEEKKLYMVADEVLCYSEKHAELIASNYPEAAGKVKTILHKTMGGMPRELNDAALKLKKQNFGFQEEDVIVLLNTVGAGDAELKRVLELMDELMVKEMRLRLVVSGSFNPDLLPDFKIGFLTRVTFTGKLSDVDFLNLVLVAETVILMPAVELKSNLYASILALGKHMISSEAGCPSFLRTAEMMHIIPMKNNDLKTLEDDEVLRQFVLSVVCGKKMPVKKSNVEEEIICSQR